MQNKALKKALKSFDEVERRYVRALEDKGLKFAERGSDDDRCAKLRDELRSRDAIFRNGGASIRVGWLSKACVECTGRGGSETFSTTFRCHRDCYFCFNYNLADYGKFVNEGCPWESELKDAYDFNKGEMAALALTGGEPLLNLDESIRFLNRAQELFPDAHKRLYTSGDLLTEDGAKRLHDAGLNEIRFSIKQDDPDDLRERVLANMKMATRYLDDVMVEMPIVPGTRAVMEDWMRRFADNGIRGMNLLEFCFPFHSWEEFDKRGFTMRNPPFPVMYDYGYSGGLAISGSEELALELMLFGIEEDLGFGMHYCSLENKHRSEMRQKNEPARNVHPIFEFDEEDFFMKTAKVYGPDVEPAKLLLGDAGCREFYYDDEEDSLAFAPRFLKILEGSSVQPALAYNVMESAEGESFLREVGLKLVEK